MKKYKTPRQRARERRARARQQEIRAIEPSVSPAYIQRCHEIMEQLDQVEEPIVHLVWEYGLDRTMRVVRECYGRWEIARKRLEEERLRNERHRWERGNGRLPHG